MADPTELSEEIGKLTATAKTLGEQMKEAATTDESRYNDLKAQLDKVTEDYKGLVEEQRKAERDAEADARLKQLEADLSAIRSPSKASVIGPGTAKAEPGTDNFFATLASANSMKLAGSIEAMGEAKAALDAMGSTWQAPDPAAKATVGDTDAAGGYLVPNPVVADINLQATAPRSVVDLFDNVNGVRGSAVDIPWEQEGISRAVIALPGATKENSNFIANNYTATLYTLARIFDVGNQLLRHSQGAAERLVRSKLARAFALGEDYYAINGSGTNQPYGLLTALDNSASAYITTFSSPADNTVAGSVITAVLSAAGDLANRGAVPDAVVLNSADFYRAWRQGTDEAGFFSDPFRSIAAIGQDVAGPGGFRWRHSPNMPTDHLIVGEYGTTQFFRGDGYRVDTSSEAGDRWDKNLTGFRGEEEIAFDARPAVFTGKFQLIENVHA